MKKTSAAPATYRPTALVARTPELVLKDLRRRALAGEVHSAGPHVRMITTGPHVGQYAMPVMLRIVERRKSKTPLVIACTASALTLFGLAGWVLSSLSGGALAILLVTVLVIFVTGVHRATRKVTVTTTTTTRVTVR